MKKSLLTLISIMFVLILYSSNVFSATVSGFEYYHDGRLRQNISGTLKNSCGGMAALHALNYDARSHGNRITIANSKKKVKKAIKRIANYVGNSVYSYFSVYDLKRIMENRWRWGYVSLTARGSFDNEYKRLQRHLNNDIPVITLMKGNSTFCKSNINHFVLVYGADDYRVKYVDPWNGQKKFASKSEFKRKWHNYNAIAGKR